MDSDKIIIDGSVAKHICDSSHSPLSTNKVGAIINAKKEMKERCEQIALIDVVKTSIQISNEVSCEFKAKYEGTPQLSIRHCILIHAAYPYVGLRTDQMKSMVHRVRSNEFKDWEGLIVSQPLCGCDKKLS